MIFVFFTASSTKLPTYVFPSFLSLAIITAVLWDDFLKKDPAGGAINGTKTSYYLLPLIVALGSVGALIYIYIDYPAILGGVAISCIFLAFGFCLSLIAFINKKFIISLSLIIYSLAIFLYPLSALVLPVIERYETSKEISLKLSSLMKPGERIASESNYLAGISFYAGKIPTDIDKHHALVQFLNSEGRVWCVLKDKNHRDLYDPKVSPDHVKPSYMVYKLGKRSIVTNEIPRGGLYILKRERPK
ncbi:MAG: hypothetical protein Q8N91_00840 [Candidatus Omnitrophota bacterium]|nr:hypothetical protein [Candidatus Omnitrophota bacterium]